MATLLASYDASPEGENGWTPLYNGAARTYSGDSFKTPNDGINYKLTNLDFNLRAVGSPTDNMTVSIYAHTGTYGTSGGLPTGSPLESVTVAASVVTSSFTNITFNFSGTTVLTANTAYCITIFYNGGDVSNRIDHGLNSTPIAYSGTYVRSADGSTWDGRNDEYALFHVYGSAPSNGNMFQLF